jgi:hypothetical protein
MNAVITEIIRVDDQHGIRIIDDRLVPGEEVEVIVRTASANQPVLSLSDIAATMCIDAPPDYSVNFEQVLR